MRITPITFVNSIRAAVTRPIGVSFNGRIILAAYDQGPYANHGYLYCLGCKTATFAQDRVGHAKNCPTKRDPSQIVHVFGEFGGGAIFGNEASRIREHVKRVVKSERSE